MSRMRMPVLAVAATALLAAAGAAGAQPTAPAAHGHSGGHPARQAQPSDARHSFAGAQEWAKRFDDPSRDAWQRPDQILDALHLTPTSRVANIGAGTGYFSSRIANRVRNGKVFAVDIEPEMVGYLGERGRREQLDTLVPVKASAASPNLPEPVDVVLIVDTYHHIGNRVAYFKMLRDSLRPDARLAIVDFTRDAPEGPPRAMRIPPEQVTAELAAAGYLLVATHTFLLRQYFLVFARTAS